MAQNMDYCARCGGQMIGIMVGSTDGWLCEKCHYKGNPFEEYETFRDVLLNTDDQVLVRQLLDQYCTPDVKRIVGDEFNRIMKQRHEIRCHQLGIVKEAGRD